MKSIAGAALQGEPVILSQRIHLRIALAAVLTLAYAALWTLNTKPLDFREHFYQTYYSFPASTPQPFGDLGYALIWLDCVRAGAPTDQPCSLGSPIPWAYPPAWLLVAPTGLSIRDTVPMAALFYVGLIAMVTYLCNPRSFSEVCYDGLFLVSPPLVLALERCNLDVLVFLMLGLAVALANRKAVMGAFGLVWVAAFMKMYPGAAFLAFVRKKVDVLVAGLGGLTLLAYLLAIRRQLKLIYNVIPQTEFQSFGSREVFLILGKKLQAMGHPMTLTPAVIALIAQAMFTILVALLVFVFVRRGIDRDWKPSTEVSQYAFAVGGLVYSLCWTIGMNYNYRYIYVAMTLPQAWAWASAKSQWRWFYRAYLLAALVMAWLALFQFKHPWIEIGHALLGWFLYGVFLFTLILLYWRVLVQELGDGTGWRFIRRWEGAA
jgi:hypothetical protein